MSLFIVLPPVGEPHEFARGSFSPEEEIEIVEKAMQSCIVNKIDYPIVRECPYTPHILAASRRWEVAKELLRQRNVIVYYDEGEPDNTGIPNVLVLHEPGGRRPFFGALVLKVPSPTFLGC